MKSLSISLFVLLAVLVQGCTYPEPAQIEQKDSRPALGISGAPESATLYVDGLKMGMANQYDGEKNVLLVESGTHLVEVKSAGGEVLHSETVFLSGSTTKVLAVKP